MAGAPLQAEWHEVGGDPLAYWRLMCDLWDQCAVSGDDLMILEQDVVCRSDVLQSFKDCPEPWCAYRYDDICHPECMDAWANTLGCTRFRNVLIRATPGLVASISRPGHRDWHNLCDGIGGNHDRLSSYDPDERWGLRGFGYTHHWHGPAVIHHHNGRNDEVRQTLGLRVWTGS